VVVRDIAKGTGPAVGPTDYVMIDYVQGDYTTGAKIYRAWGGPPYGTGGVILAPIERWRGLTIGMKGMRVGGRRQIIVPPRLSGIEPGHADWRRYVVWEVALRGIYARGCADDGEPCRSGP
jgi:hypothetical protein